MNTVAVIYIIGVCIISYGLTNPVSTTEAYLDDSTPSLPPLNQTGGAKLVITHIIKTVQFDVGLLDTNETSTESANDITQPYIQTNISLLNPKLLKHILNKATNHTGVSLTTLPTEPTVEDETEPTDVES